MKHLKPYVITVIPHKDQRYKTCGDYQLISNERWCIEVSKCKADYEFLVAVHELIECYLCERAGIKEKYISAFDIQWEIAKSKGLCKNIDEAGNDPKAPYHREHKFATKLEKLLCKELGVDWDTYENDLEKLHQSYVQKK